MLTRKKESKKTEKDWFQFSAQLFFHLCSDYIALRLLYCLEPLTTGVSILVKMIEVAEKSLKLYITVNNKSNTALSDSRQNYGHNIENMRIESAKYNTVFDDDDIKKFSKDLDDKDGKLYQYLRYGSQETTQGMSANLNQIMPVIDKIFFKSILLLPENERRLFNFVSLLKNLLMQSSFDQSQNPTLLLAALQKDNYYIQEYIEYCILLDKEHLKFLEQINNGQVK
jgi:hypothetical protein